MSRVRYMCGKYNKSTDAIVSHFHPTLKLKINIGHQSQLTTEKSTNSKSFLGTFTPEGISVVCMCDCVSE